MARSLRGSQCQCSYHAYYQSNLRKSVTIHYLSLLSGVLSNEHLPYRLLSEFAIWLFASGNILRNQHEYLPMHIAIPKEVTAANFQAGKTGSSSAPMPWSCPMLRVRCGHFVASTGLLARSWTVPASQTAGISRSDEALRLPVSGPSARCSDGRPAQWREQSTPHPFAPGSARPLEQCT